MVPKTTLNDGNFMPMLGLGTYNAKPSQVYQAVKAAIDLGYRHLDCAYAYENESEVGAAIRDKIAEGIVKREDMFIVTKLWDTYHEPDLVEPAVRKSLQNLGLDYVDLYLMHTPMGHKSSGIENNFFNVKFVASDTNFVDTYKAMEELVRKGLTKSIGVSNFNRRQIERILEECSIPPVTNQVEVHPYFSQVKLTEFCRSKNITITAYSSFGNPGSPFRTDDGAQEMLSLTNHKVYACNLEATQQIFITFYVDPIPLYDPVVEALAKKHQTTTGQIILRWLFQRDIITIPKTISETRLAANINIFGFALTAEDMAAMNGINQNHRIARAEFAANHKDYPFNDEY